MSTIPQVALATTFLDWRTRTNDIIDLVNITKIGTPAKIQTLEDVFNYIGSAGVHTGCAITDNLDGTIAVSAGEALLRVGSTEDDELVSAVVDADPVVGLVDNDLNFIYVDYNSGVPLISNTLTSSFINNKDICLIGIVSREGVDLTILEAKSERADQYNKLNNMLLDTQGFIHVNGGTQISESGTNTRKVSVQSGEFYRGLNKYTHSAYDTAAADTFEYYYRDSGSGWIETSGTVISNVNYDDGTGTLGTITAGKYVVNWVFLKVGSNADELYVLYGQNEYDSINDAQIEVVPTILPDPLGELGVMIGRIIIKQASTSLNIVESAFGNQFRSTESLIKEVINGGTGVNTLNQHGVVIGNATDPVHVTGIGTDGQILTSNGPGQNPTFENPGATLGGLTSAQFLRSDADDIFTGTLTAQKGDDVSFIDFVNTVTTNELHLRTFAGDYLGFRPAPLGVADGTKDFYYNFTDSRWEFDEVPYVGSIPVWYSGNDGAGSGLDADTLDGNTSANFLSSWNSTTFQGAIFTLDANARLRLETTVAASLTSTNHAFQIGLINSTNLIMDHNDIMARSNGAASILSLNRLGGTVNINGSLAWHAGNDGIGSGLDADLLDGLNSDTEATVSSIAARNASGQIKATHFITTGAVTATDPTHVMVELNDGLIRRQTKANFITNLGLWTSGNDGAGSGLDADTLDGIQGANYARSNVADTISGVHTHTARPAFNGGTSGSTSPFTVDSTQVVVNLNADLLDGLNASSFVRSNQADTVSGILTFDARPAFNGGTSGSSSPFTVDSTQVVANLNSKIWDGANKTVSTSAPTGGVNGDMWFQHD